MGIELIIIIVFVVFKEPLTAGPSIDMRRGAKMRRGRLGFCS
jgi:hypothetical protein